MNKLATKKCVNCKVDKPEETFLKRADHPHLRRNQCFDCRKAYTREFDLQHKFGIGVSEYDRMGEVQSWVCAVCGKKPKGKSRAGILHVDHDHETGAVRALLCMGCNIAFGMLKENKETIMNLYHYACRWNRG